MYSEFAYYVPCTLNRTIPGYPNCLLDLKPKLPIFAIALNKGQTAQRQTETKNLKQEQVFNQNKYLHCNYIVCNLKAFKGPFLTKVGSRKFIWP